MMLLLLLTELTHLDVKLVAEPDGLKVDAPAEVLTDELRQVMIGHKAALLRFAAFPYVETVDGLGVLTGNRIEQDLTFVAPERQEAWRYKIGVVGLHDGIERFYWPRMVAAAQPDAPQANEWEQPEHAMEVSA